MPITQEQLDALKAANYAKSVAWEAATFTDGDRVLSHGHLVNRRGTAWVDNEGCSYETLSRWIRHKLGRRTYDVKNGAFIANIGCLYPVGLLPPVAERNNYSPWNPAMPTLWARPASAFVEAAAAVEAATATEAAKTADVVQVQDRLIEAIEKSNKSLKGYIALLEQRIAALEAH